VRERDGLNVETADAVRDRAEGADAFDPARRLGVLAMHVRHDIHVAMDRRAMLFKDAQRRIADVIAVRMRHEDRAGRARIAAEQGAALFLGLNAAIDQDRRVIAKEHDTVSAAAGT